MTSQTLSKWAKRSPILAPASIPLRNARWHLFSNVSPLAMLRRIWMKRDGKQSVISIPSPLALPAGFIEPANPGPAYEEAKPLSQFAPNTAQAPSTVEAVMPALQQLLDSSNQQLDAIASEREATKAHVAELEQSLQESNDRLAQLDTEEARTRKIMGEVGNLVGDLRRDMNGDAPEVDPAADPAAQLAAAVEGATPAADDTAGKPEAPVIDDGSEEPTDDTAEAPRPVAGAGSPYAG